MCGDVIEYQGKSFSPRQFLIHITGSIWNAWLALWVRCPGDARWHLADTRRRILRRGIAVVAGSHADNMAAEHSCGPAASELPQPAARARRDKVKASPPADLPINQSGENPAALLANQEQHVEKVELSKMFNRQINEAEARRRRDYLRRTDIVRDDQPDLTMSMPQGHGCGPHGAGRAGPHDRRAPRFPFAFPFWLGSKDTAVLT